MTNAPIVYKPFSWDALAPFTSLANAVQGLEGTPRAFDPPFMEEWLRLPGRSAEEDCLLASSGDELLGYMFVHQERPIGRVVLEGGVLQAHRGKGVGTRLFEWALDCGRQASASIAHVAAQEGDTDQIAFLKARGFTLVRHHVQMRWSGDSVPEPKLPDGFSFRPFRAGDEGGLTKAQNAAFSTQWGFSPNTVEQVAYSVNMSRSDTGGVALLMAGDEVVGYCWTQTAGEDTSIVGSVLMVGVHPKYQGKGLGRAVLFFGMTSLLQRGTQVVELTVDRENAAARELYTSVGFVKTGGQEWYEATLSAD
jgi:mycothiol synthase